MNKQYLSTERIRDPYNRGSAQQSCRKFSDLAQLQHSVATEMGLDFQCGCGPSLYHIKINQYFIFLTFAETVYQCITIFIWGRRRKIKILSQLIPTVGIRHICWFLCCFSRAVLRRPSLVRIPDNNILSLM